MNTQILTCMTLQFIGVESILKYGGGGHTSIDLTDVMPMNQFSPNYVKFSVISE